ncbi:putative transcription factor C2H2 family [Helianthus annuus]|nr:putative transcription factor C2H2 family [Helianthus annuus]
MSFPTTHLPEFIGIPAKPQKTLTFIITFLIITPNSTLSQSSFSSANDENYSSSSINKFEPSLAIVVGILSIVFSLTFLTIIYVKCCHMSSSSSTHRLNQENFGNLPRTRSRFSGIDKTVIESLPYFKFSALKGWKNGLECSVCLSAFEDIELLRLLPKCKHAFHIDCIDQWLENHSSCPLCRVKVVKDDIALSALSNSLRFNESEPSSLGLFIEREGSSRFGTNVENDQDQVILHKFNHRIMISNENDPVMLKTRWSNVSSSDILFLKSEMITCVASNRFDHQLCPEVEGNNGHNRRVEEPRRSVSEITVHPRFLEGEVRVDEKRLRRLWLPIARRTVERFANKENNNIPDGQRLEIEKSREQLDV